MKRSTKLTPDKIFEAAHVAGLAAVAALKVAPMVVNQHASVVDDNSPVVGSYFVADGICGFAWVNIKPANSAFAKFMLETRRGRRSDYHGGVNYWIHDFNQSYQKKLEYAAAFAKVLNENGIRAIADSRLD